MRFFLLLLLMRGVVDAVALRAVRTPFATARSSIKMGAWTDSDMKAKSMPLPAAVEGLLSDDTPRAETRQCWAALRSCFATDDEAIAAAQRNTGTILPYLNTPGNIYGSYAYLVDGLGLEAARDVCRKNPGILQCSPRMITQSSPDDIVRTANFVDAIESAPIPLAVRNNLDKVVFSIGAAIVAKRILIDCAGQSCGGS